MNNLKVRAGSELTVTELYSLLCLRVEVFVVEQHIAYLDLDGRDLLSTTHHLWVAEGSSIIACLRVSEDRDDLKIARVCTRLEYRGRGLAQRLMGAAVAAFGERSIVLEAQSYLIEFYRRFGFFVEGPEFLDDGVPHRLMRRGSGG